MTEIPIGKPFRIIDSQWYNQFVFTRLNETEIRNEDTLDVGEINVHLEIEWVEGYRPGDPERIKRYLAKKATQ